MMSTETDTITITTQSDTLDPFDPLSYSSSMITSGSTMQYSITSGGTAFLNNGLGPFYTNNTGPYTISNITPAKPVIEVKGDGADVLLNGKSLKTFMEGVEDRLAILQPDPAKLEKYAALRKAYEHYKLMEKLVNED